MFFPINTYFVTIYKTDIYILFIITITDDSDHSHLLVIVSFIR